MPGVEICRYTDVPSPLDDAAEAVKNIGQYIDTHMGPNDKGLLALSGGVDSSVVAELCEKAVPGRVRIVHIDHGYMRSFDGLGESGVVCDIFSNYKGFEFMKAQDFFYRHTFGVEDAEEKRDGFRYAYSDILKRAMKGFSCNVLLDGTIRPDIEETEAGIKKQHNVGIEGRYGATKVIEPLAGLVKAQVRAVAKELGIDHLRQPFPGPGLMVRTPGPIDLKRLEVERLVDDIVETELDKYFKEKQGAVMVIGPNGEQTPFQYFAATFINREPDVNIISLSDMFAIQACHGFLGSIGLEPDYACTLGTKVTGKTPDNKRIYADAICVHDQTDGGSDYEKWPEVARIAGANIENVNIARVLMDISPYSAMSGSYDVVIRVVDSTDARTAKVSNVEPAFLNHLAKRIRDECGDIANVYFDITPKPPGTIEFE